MMHESSERLARESSELANDIATAPGDLPLREVAARFSALEWQFRHDNTIAPMAPRPAEPVQVSATSGADMYLQRATVYYTVDGSDPNPHSSAAPMDVVAVDWDVRVGYLTRWQAVIPGQPAGTVVRYRIGGWLAGIPGAADRDPDEWANDGQGFWFRFPGEKGITTFAFTAEEPRRPMPKWVHDAVIYHIFLDRFHPGTADGSFDGEGEPRERHGGTLAGVRRALPYLADLGVTCLWFSPLGTSETYHRYDTMDYFGVDPALGSPDDLRDLIQEAHGRGMRIWLDYVPSHCSWHHPAFEAAQRDRSAPTYSWFTFDGWPDNYRSFLQVIRHLPSLNTSDPGARRHLIDAATYWLREFDVDGYRVDHVIAPSMDFWVALRKSTQAVKDDVVLVGEATDTPDALRRYRGRLHGVLDFPLARALRSTFGTGTWGVQRLDHFLGAYERYMADGPGRVSFLDNHDMDRFLWVAGDDVRRLAMAALCQFTLDATPTIYYGTEIGMSQHAGASEAGLGGDAEARRNMIWDERLWNTRLLSFYRSLIELRRAEPVLRSSRRVTVHLDIEGQTYAYLKLAETPADSSEAGILAAFNLSDEERTLDIPMQRSEADMTVLMSTAEMPVIHTDEKGIAIHLAPMTATILSGPLVPPPRVA